MGQGVRANMGFTPEELEEMRRADAEVDLEFSQAEVDGCLEELLEDELDAEIADAALRSNLSHDEWAKHKRRLKRNAKRRERQRRLYRENPEYVRRLLERQAQYYSRNWFDVLERQRKYRALHPETVRLTREKYRNKNRDTINARARDRRRENPLPERLRYRRYYERNRDLFMARQRLRRLLRKHDGPLYVLTSVELG